MITSHENRELSEISPKLNKLDSMEKHPERVDDEIKELKESFTFVNDIFDEIKVKQRKQGTSIKSLEESIANHTHVTGPAFYDTAHGPDFFPAQCCT